MESYNTRARGNRTWGNGEYVPPAVKPTIPVRRIAWTVGALILFALAPTVATGQVTFGGEVKPELGFTVPRAGNYAAPLNRGNALGLTDVTFRNEINLKLGEMGETGALDVWLQLKQYPIAQMLTGVSSLTAASAGVGEPQSGLLESAVTDVAWSADPYIYTVDILRANVAWTPVPDIRVILGRQSYLTGYGYGWNPVDLANPPKDPTDVSAYVRGVDGLTIRYSPAAWLVARVYGALPSEGRRWSYDQLLAGAEVTLLAPVAEVKLAGLYGGEEGNSDQSDAYPHAVAAALYLDVVGIGVYGEGVVRSRSRRNAPDPTGGATSVRDNPIPSALLGLEYYFASGLAVAAEYFANGEGWDQGAREDYADALDVLNAGGGITGEYYGLYTPSYFARHYGLINLTLPWYDVDASFNANVVYSFDSRALFLTPTAIVNLNYEGTLVTEFRYGGLYSLEDDRRNEAWLSPVGHTVMWNVRYHY